MKKYLSIFMLAARGTLCKALGLMTLTGAAQVGVYYASLRTALGEREMELQNQLLHPEYGSWDVPYPALETILDKGILHGWISVTTVWIIGFALFVLLLSTEGHPLRGGDSKTRLTLMRLSVKERWITLCYMIYNFAMLLIFWSFSTAIAFLICKLYYAEVDPNTYGSQSIFLMFYRNNLFHSLLPLADTLRYVRNIFMLLALAVSASCHGFWERREKKSLWRVFGYLYLATVFPKGLADSGTNLWWIVLCVALMILELYCVINQLEEGEEA
ncbi:MAG: hypothetical protein IIX88_00160 [Firmicutes bacterium]|nr:hypothetical protein [Bacillota bacterium]